MADTDVRHSIAGYYYQMLLATRELFHLLSNSTNTNDYVAVEKGADIRVHTKNDKFVEAKFYKDEYFTRNSTAIRHTIYNFYNDFKENQIDRVNGDEYLFTTNLPISRNDKKFFLDWNQRVIKDWNPYLRYIKQCLMYEHIKHDKIMKARFEDFKEALPCNKKEEQSNKFYYQNLEEHLHSNPSKYYYYVDPEILDDSMLRDFISKISFNFPEEKKEKSFSIHKLKTEIIEIMKDDNYNLKDHQMVRIYNLILEEFFRTTYSKDNQGISMNKAKEIIDEFEELDLKYLNQQIESQKMEQYIEAIYDYISTYENELSADNPDLKDEILSYLIECKEQLFEELETHGVESVSKRYLVGSYVSDPYRIIEMLKVMCEASVSKVSNLGEINLRGLDGLNNFSYLSLESYCIKGGGISIKPQSLLVKFAEEVKQRYQYSELSKTNTVIFDSPAYKCKFDMEVLDNTVPDISDTSDENYKLKAMLKSVNYRCNYCLRLDRSCEGCSFKSDLKGGLK